MSNEPSELDLRLMTVWHGRDDDRDLHYSLYNHGSDTVEGFRLCLTGTMWVEPDGTVRGGKLLSSLSNFLEIQPEIENLPPGGVWPFTVRNYNRRPSNSGDGPLSAYIVRRDGGTSPVMVLPLARSDVQADPAATVSGSIHEGLNGRTAPRRTISVIPFPNVVSVTVALLLATEPALMIADTTPQAQRTLALRVADLCCRVQPTRHCPFSKTGQNAQRVLHISGSTDPRLGSEGYRIDFEGEDVRLEAATDCGLAYGVTTLCQMIIGALSSPDQFGFPSRGTITDIPRFEWRGVHLDVARTYYSVGELQALVDLLAWLKINVLHLHLNDDEGWRIDVPGYPEVARVAAWRGHGLPIPPLLGSAYEPYGGVYSPRDFTGLLEHAVDFGIRVLPELDVPGHAHAALTAMPQLRDPGDTGGYHSIQGFFGNALNPCLEETYSFLGAAFDTLMNLFPSPWVHIGGDEIGPETWSQSPLVIAEAARRGLAETGRLQDDILQWVHRRVAQAGRKTVVWDDALRPGLLDPGQTIAMSWQHPERAHEWAAQGYDVVLTPGNAYYLDMMADTNWNSVGGHWAGAVPLEKTYNFEPGLGWPVPLLKRLRGVQACIWGEFMNDRRVFDALVFPRIFAFAERSWIEPSVKDFPDFLKRAEACRARVLRRQETRP